MPLPSVLCAFPLIVLRRVISRTQSETKLLRTHEADNKKRQHREWDVRLILAHEWAQTRSSGHLKCHANVQPHLERCIGVRSRLPGLSISHKVLPHPSRGFSH